MRKKIKTCIGIFIFILSLFLYNSIVLADHPDCGSTSCAKFSIESYLCPNSEATDDDSAQNCMYAIMDGDTSGMELLTAESTVPFKYDDTKSTLIAVVSYLDPYQLDRIQAYTTTLKFDYDNLQLIATMYNDDPAYGTDYPYSVQGKRKTGQANLTLTYTGDDCEYCYGDHIATTNDYEDGLVLLNYSTKTAGDYLLPHNTAAGPYPTYYVFKVRDTATAGDVTIKAKEESVNIYGVYMEASRYNEDGNSSSHFFVTENSTFKLGNGLEVQNPITNLTVYKDKNKNSNEIYKFGVPGGSGNTAYPMEFSASENAYDLYLPSGTTSIYIYAESSDGASVTGDGVQTTPGTSGSFTVTGTTGGDDPQAVNYIITYHVPDNNISSITTPGRWNTASGSFNKLNYTNIVYLLPSQTSSVTISSTLVDSTGGFETKINGTTSKAKAQTATVSDTLTNVTDGTVYKVISYGADCFGAYNTALGTCESKEYTITYKIMDRYLKSATVTGTLTGSAVYGIAAADFSPTTKLYTVNVPHSESSVLVDVEVSDPDHTAGIAQISKALSDGDNSVVVTTERLDESDTSDTYGETYTFTIHRLSEDAAMDSFTSTSGGNNVGTLTWGTDTVDGSDSNMTIKNATLTVGSSVTTTTFTTTANKETSYVKSEANGKTLAENWTIDTDNDYEVIIYSESCKSDYSGIANNVCKKTKIKVHAVRQSDNDDIDEITVADAASSSTSYTVVDKGSNTYSVTVPSGKTSVYLAVTPDDKTSPATVTYDETKRNSSTGMVTLGSENTSITVRVTAQDTSVYTDYTITIHRASTNANLNLLSFSKGDFGTAYSTTSPTENPTGKIEYSETGITFNAQAEYPNARLDNKDTGTRTYTNEPWTFTSDKTQTKTITVYSESCYTTGDTCVSKTYTITLNRLKTESKLDTITVKKGSDNSVIRTFTISSDTDPTTYTVGIPSTETSAIVEVTKGDTTETVTFNSDTTESLSNTVNPLSTTTDNTQTVHVVSEYGGDYKKDYTINLHKVNDSTDLTFTSDKGIGTTPITAHPTDANKFVLKILAAETSASITSTASSTAYINTEATGATKTETWTFASPTEYTVTVYPERCKAAYNNGTACTASDGVVYTLIRNAVSNNTQPKKIHVKSADGTETYGTIDYTGSGTPSTTISVPVGTTSVKIEVETDVGQEASLPGTDGVVSGLGEGANAQTVTITASDETTTSPYNFTVYVPHTAKDLTSISVASPATLEPATIAAATDNHFTVKVSDTVTSVSVSAGSSETSYINAETNGNALTNASWNVSAASPSDFTIKIFPESCKAAYREAECSDSDATIYTLSVQKLSSDKTISGVSVNDVPATWDSTESKWKVLLPSTATSATITCTATAPTTCSGTTIAADDFHDGANTASVSITAEDESTGTNSVEIYRVSDKIGISDITFSNGVLKETSTPDGTYAYTGKFSDTKSTTTVVPTAKYNGFVNGTLIDWSLTGDTVPDYTFTIKSESCKDEYASNTAIAATCASQDYTISYEAISSSGTLGSISVKGNDNVEYFTDTITGFEYTVYVPSTVTSATIKVEPEVAGTGVSPETYTISSLVEGANPTVNITVTPQDTSVSANTYQITVYKLNNDALLKTLTASTGTIATLSDTVFDYDLTLTDGTTASTNISAEAKHGKAKLYVNGSLSGVEKQITSESWDLSNNTFTIKVKSEACDHQSTVLTECEEKTYTITKKVLSNSVILDGLEVKPSDSGTAYTLKPTFSETETNYSVDLPNGTTGAIILIDPGTKGITISSQTIMTTGGTITKDSENKNKLTVSGLKTGDNTVTINLLAEDNTTPGQYTVNLHVKNTSTEISLSANPGEITGTGTNLTLTVPNGTNTSTLTATLPSGATVKMNGTDKTPGSDNKVNDSWTFVDGDKYEIEVTPEEGEKVTYTVTVSVLPPDQSGDNSITSLTANPGNISGSGTNRTLTVPFGTTSTEISVTSATGSKVTMNGTAKNTNSGTETWSGFSHGDTFVINVEAENGDDQDYTITVNIQEPTDEDKDSSLKSITVTKSESVPAIIYTVFEPTFIPSQTGSESYTYTVFVPYETVYVDLDAEATNASLLPTFSSQNGIALAVGDNQETISVTSADGSSTTVYNINIYRISNEARLDAFDIGASDLNETFDKDITDYTALISNQYPSTSVTYTLRYNKAYVTSETNTATSDTWNFNSGANTEYTLHVYAESCKEKFKDVIGNTCVDKEYKITATFFNPKITSDTYGLTLTTTPSGEATIDIIADAVYKSTGADIKGEQTDNPTVQLKLYEKDETTEVADTAPLATGMVLKLIINSAEYDKRYIVVPGDTNGNAVVDIVDLGQVVDHILAYISGSTDGLLDGVYYVAGNVQSDAEIDIADLGMVVDIILADMVS